MPGADLVDERFLGGVDVRAGGPVQLVLVLNEVDRAEIAEHRHRQADQARQRALVVQRRAEERTDLGQNSGALLRRNPWRPHSDESRARSAH